MRDEDTEKIALARVGTVINGKWTVDRLIGVGGMAAVYAATHRNSKRAALKIMHPELSAQASIRERFLREGYLSNMVDHPGVVTVDDDDVTEDGCAFLVMELVEGETLEARLRRKGPLPPEEVLSFMDQVLHALATAHTRGVVHRDLKPENMLLAPNGELKLLDFGIARARALSTDPTKTLTEGLMGTPAFMPPEQARGRWEEVDAQSDVWALGATMFTLLTGRNVHQAATTNEALAVAMMHHAPPLEQYRPDLPKPVLELVNKALAFEKKDRWPNATVMLLAVRKASSRIEDESLEAEALAAAHAVQSDSQPEIFLGEPEEADQEDALDASDSAPRRSSPSVEPPTNPVSSEAPFAAPVDPAPEAASTPAAASEPAWTSEPTRPLNPPVEPPSVAPASEPSVSSPHSVPSAPVPSEAPPAASAPSASSPDALPARRIVPFADVPVTSPGMTRPTETTTARSALSTAPPHAPTKNRRSIIGAAVVALVLAIVAVVVLSGTGSEAPTHTHSAQRVSRPPPPAEVHVESPAKESPAKESPAKPAAQPESASPKLGEAVELEELPLLVAEPSSVPSAAPPAPVYQAQPKPKSTPTQAQPGIFGQARNLAVKRATVRSDNLKTKKQE